MEAGARKLLPRIQPTSNGERRSSDDANEPLQIGKTIEVHNGLHNGLQNGSPNHPWQSPAQEETGYKRKRQRVEQQHQSGSQTLPGVHHLLTAQGENEKRGHARVICTANGAYFHEGPYKFLAPHPQRDFPDSVFNDPRPLSFASVEPELMAVFRRTWYLRHYIRLKNLRKESWLDHIFFNDCFGIENTLYTWSSRYEPGTLQYPASLLYKQCLWLLFNRSVQASQTSPAYAQVVEDGLHYSKTIEIALGPSGDRSVLLLPLFLLGVSAFFGDQRRLVWDALDRMDPSLNDEAVVHAAKSLQLIWSMMDDGNASLTWDWERYQAHNQIASARDRSLVDLLTDPLAPVPAVTLRSPEGRDLDASRCRAAPSQSSTFPQAIFPAAPLQPFQLRREEGVRTPPHPARSPPRNHSIVSVDTLNSPNLNGRPEGTPNRHLEPGPGSTSCLTRQLLQQPPTYAATFHSANVEISQSLQRRSSKTKCSQSPCQICGKELKNPSDAQKHQLQHSKPFRCAEPNCTRVQGFATENDLQRHRKSVHRASPRIGTKIGYVCSACPEPSDGTTRKWWPRLDNFKAHIRRKHQDQDEEELINASASADKPNEGSYGEHMNHTSTSLRWPEDRDYDKDGRRMNGDGSGEDEQRYPNGDGNEYGTDGSGNENHDYDQSGQENGEESRNTSEDAQGSEGTEYSSQDARTEAGSGKRGREE